MAPLPWARKVGSAARSDIHRAEEVGIHQGPQLAVRCLLERADQPIAGIVDQHVDSTEALDRCRDGGFGVAGANDVERKDKHPVRR